MKVSSKNVIGIREFLNNYILYYKKQYQESTILTHRSMGVYLYEKGISSPNRLAFSRVKDSEILSGDILLVKDEAGQIIPYMNPLRENFNLLLEELNSEVNKLKAIKRRKEILSEQGYVITNKGDIVEKEFIDEKEEIITSKLNRAKKLANKNAHKMRGEVGLK